MNLQFIEHMKKQIANLKAEGLFKEERVLTSPQQSKIEITGGRKVFNFLLK